MGHLVCDESKLDVLFVLVVGAGVVRHDEIVGAPVPGARLGGVGSLLLVVSVSLLAVALDVCTDLLLLVVVVVHVPLALGPWLGFACSGMLAAVRVVVVDNVVHRCNPCVLLNRVLAQHLRGVCCHEL